MKNKVLVYPYKLASKSGILLRDALSAVFGERIYHATHEYVVNPGEVVVHWGSGMGPLANERVAKKVFNPSPVIARCVNKIDCFERLDGFDVPKVKWTTSAGTATLWAENGHKVFCRVNVEGRDGKGLVATDNPDKLVQAPLYTRGEVFHEEYRIHTFGGEFMCGLVKVGKPGANPDIRTGGNGWNYHREPKTPWSVQECAISAARALKLDLGAIDVIHNEQTDTAWFLEANTAPELGPYTAPQYAAKIKGVVDGL